jgi:uncharacterized protein YggE
VHGLALVVGDRAGVLAAARQVAWRDARARAERYAALAGVGLGRVVRIEELAGAPHTLALAGGYQAQAARAAAGPPVVVGETQVPAMVAVTWALLDAPQPGVVERSWRTTRVRARRRWMAWSRWGSLGCPHRR